MILFWFTAVAYQDMDEIFEFLHSKSRSGALRVLDDIETKCQLLSDFPALGAAWQAYGPNVHFFPAGKFVLFYRPLPKETEILRVLHSARDFPPTLDRP